MIELQPEQLREEIAQMIEASTHPAFVEALRAVKATPIEQFLVAGSQRLTPQALREKGVPLPADIRISSRYFDDDLPTSVLRPITAFVVCCSGGAGSVAAA